MSLINPWVAAIFIIAYLLLWFFRGIGLNIRVIQGYNLMKLHEKLPWNDMLEDIENGTTLVKHAPRWHPSNIERLEVLPAAVKPARTIHAVMIAVYNESREVVAPTIESVLASNYNMNNVILMIAYEERGGPETAKMVKELIATYGDKFLFAEAVEHPKDMPHEVIGKGGNITFAGKVLQQRLATRKIDPIRVLVTTLDSDNRPHPNYLSALMYTFCLCPEP